MADRLRGEIRQGMPFRGIEEEALLNVHRTAGHLQHALHQVLKGHGLTEPQYNVLRILRGAGVNGLRCREVGERMITRDPDVTRLLERLQRQGLIERRRDDRDRRVIFSRITSAGGKLLKELDPVLQELSESLLGHMGRDKLEVLIDLLEEARRPTEDGSTSSALDPASSLSQV